MSKIWAIFKISYDPQNRGAEGGICGSCFFYAKNKFITAHHCFNKNVFIPNKGYPKVKIFLANNDGDIINNPEIFELFPDYDLTIGQVKNKSVEELDFIEYPQGKKIYNLGFPSSRGLKDYQFQPSGEKLIINKIELNLEKQEGLIKETREKSISANDVNLENKTVFILNYTSELGFSGGPLFDKLSNKVIGFMSLLLLEKDDPKRRAVAIPYREFKKIL